jgi:hypothetical protein
LRVAALSASLTVLYNRISLFFSWWLLPIGY